MGGVVTYLLLQANAPIIEVLSSSQKSPVAINALFLMPPQCGKTELQGRGLTYLVQCNDGCQLVLHIRLHCKWSFCIKQKRAHSFQTAE